MPLKPNSSAGVNTGSRLLIFFMISFKLLGYSTFLSICLGAIAGLAGGFTAAWWNASEDFLTDEEEAKLEGNQEPEAPPPAASFVRRPRYGFGVRSARQARREWTFFWPGFGSVFRRKR